MAFKVAPNLAAIENEKRSRFCSYRTLHKMNGTRTHKHTYNGLFRSRITTNDRIMTNKHNVTNEGQIPLK